MYLTGKFNIRVVPSGTVKVIFADISIISLYFQWLQFNSKIFCRPKLDVLLQGPSASENLFQYVIKQIETFKKKNN